ncbi:MAG: nucleotidyltransferase family protein [Acidobacteriota bacterium]
MNSDHTAAALAQTHETLATSLRVFLGQACPESLSRALRRCEALELLQEHAEREGLSGILRLTWPKNAPTPPPLLDQRRLEIFAHNGRVRETLRVLGEAFRQAGIEVIVVKGAALLTGPYRQRLGCRPLSDIDLLVRERQLEDLETTLERLGWRRYLTRWRGDGLELDLHTHLERSALLGHRHAAFRFPSETLWRQSQPSPVGGPALRLLDPATQAAYLATHAVKHAFGRWIWLVDLCLVLPGVTQPDLERALGEARAERAWVYVRELQRVLGLSSSVRLESEPKLSLIERTWLSLVAKRRQSMGLGRVVAGLSIPTLSERLAYWREVAWPAEESLDRATPATLPATPAPRSLWLSRSLAPRAAQALKLMAAALRTAASP